MGLAIGGRWMRHGWLDIEYTMHTLSPVVLAEKSFSALHQVGTSWVARQTMQHLHALRREELELVCQILPPSGRLLEVGGGTGWQAKELASRGYDVVSIDVSSSNYRASRVWPVIEYDGSIIPFRDSEFDIIFSSNTLEHIGDAHEFQGQIYRVLKADGVACHVLPSSSWRAWTNITNILKWWSIPWEPHGEHASNAFSEIFTFRRAWWRELFVREGWRIIAEQGNGLFYTGNSIMDSRINIELRKTLALFLGSSCSVFMLRKR